MDRLMSEQQPLLDQYCDNLANYLTEHCTWLKSAGDDQQQPDSLKTPCTLIHITGWKAANNDEHNGQTRLNLEIQLLVVVSRATKNYQHMVRNFAAELSCLVSGSSFGMPYPPAQLVGAQPYTLDKALDGYAAWGVNYQHQVDLGQNLFEFNGYTPRNVWVGVSPDIGSGHQDDYQQMIPEPNNA